MPGGCQCGFCELLLDILVIAKNVECQIYDKATWQWAKYQKSTKSQQQQQLTWVPNCFSCFSSLPFLLGWHLTIQAVCKPFFNSTNVYCALHIRYRSRYLLNKTDNKDMKITTHLLEWPKSGTLTIPNVDTEVELQKFSCIADENAKWHFAREYGVSYKTKHTLSTVC